MTLSMKVIHLDSFMHQEGSRFRARRETQNVTMQSVCAVVNLLCTHGPSVFYLCSGLSHAAHTPGVKAQAFPTCSLYTHRQSRSLPQTVSFLLQGIGSRDPSQKCQVL